MIDHDLVLSLELHIFVQDGVILIKTSSPISTALPRANVYFCYHSDMSNITLVVTDLDGTIILPGFIISKAVRAVIIEAEKRNIIVSAVTGREYSEIKPSLKKLGIKGPCVFEGGALVIDTATDKILWSRQIADDVTGRVINVLAAHTTEIDWGKGLTKVEDLADNNDYKGCYSIWAAVPASEALNIIEDLHKLPNIVAPSNPAPGGDFSKWGIQVTNIEADKFHGVNALLNILNITKDTVLAIGDGNNDIPLFTAASIKVAMGNAASKLKEQADYIVPDIEHDGFVVAMDKYVL